MCQDVLQSVEALPDTLSWQQISAAVKQGRQLLVIGDEVCDVAEWVHKHPGGKVLLTYVGEDATDVTAAFHRDKDQMRKYLSGLRVASLAAKPRAAPGPGCATAERDTELEKDFRALRAKLEQAGLFKANPWFYLLMLAHVIALELAGWAVLKHLGTTWMPYLLAVALLVTAQAQAGWLQHDLGHLSVFKSRELNLLCHRFVIIHLKVCSSAVRENVLVTLYADDTDELASACPCVACPPAGGVVCVVELPTLS